MKFKNSIMTKMLIMFFAATIPLYAVGLALYNTSGRRLSVETLETEPSRIEFCLQSLEDDLERLFSLETELINDERGRKIWPPAMIISAFIEQGSWDSIHCAID